MSSSGDLVCPAPAWDFGNVKVGESLKLKHQFWLQNISETSDVVITGVNTSCACTVAAAPPAISPGREVPLPVDVKLSKGRVGPISLQVLVAQQTHPPLVLDIVGFVEAPHKLEASPEAVNFGEVRRGIEKTQHFSIAFADQMPLTVESYGISSKAVLVNLEGDRERFSNKAHFTVQLQANHHMQGDLQDKVEIRLLDKQRKVHVVTVPVRASLSGGRMFREQLFIDRLKAGEEAVCQLTLEDADGVAIQSVQFRGPDVLRVSRETNTSVRVRFEGALSSPRVLRGTIDAYHASSGSPSCIPVVVCLVP